MAFRSSSIPVLAAVVGNSAIAATKFVVAAISGSSAMLAEAIHSVLDTLNQLSPYYDGAASIIIGVILCAVALALVYESRGLLIGESADPAVTRTISAIASRDPAVAAVRTPLTMHLGPDEILLNLEIEFRTGSPAEEHTRAVNRIEEAIRSAHPAVKRIFIEARPRREPSRVDRPGIT